MSNVPPDSQQILSCWVKRPNSPKHETNTPTTTLRKTSSQQQWSNIFGKPQKTKTNPVTESCIETQGAAMCQDSNRNTLSGVGEASEMTQATIKPPKRKAINPRSPFNSFMVTLQVPRGLEFPCKQSYRSENNPASSDHSFLVRLKLPSSSFSSQGLDSHNSCYETENDTICSSQPSCLSQTSDNDVEKIVHSQGNSAIASFFAKRPTKTKNVMPRNEKTSPPKSTKPTHAPYNLLHLRPEADWFHQHVNKRQRTFPGQEHLDTYESYKNFISLPTIIPELPLTPTTTKVHRPVRRLLDSTQLQTVAMRSLSIDSLSQTRSLCENIGQQNAFDRGLFESRMWCEKYAPQKPAHHISPKSAEALSTWLYTQQARLDKMPTHKPKRAKRKTSLGGFVVEDRDLSDSDMDNDDAIMILSGPTGCGKTSAVYAVSQKLNFFVFEINASSKRTGKELTRLLEGISRNHAVHSAKNVVILVDEADLVYENEAGTFWPTIAKFASTSRRPLVITCTDQSLISLPSLKYEHIEMEPPSPTSLVDISYLIALKEGHLVDKARLTYFVAQNGNDLRKTLTSLQYWCQYGIGGLPSGADWVPKMDEMYTEFSKSFENRVISDGTWFELPSEQCDDTSLSRIARFMQEQIPEFAYTQDEIFSRPEDSLCVNSALPVSQWVEPVRLPTHIKDAQQLNDCVFPFRYECPKTRIQTLLLDIAPYMRNMIVSDAQRQLARSSAMSHLSEREQRMLLRSMRDSGIDTRNYLGFTFPAMTRMLNTGFKMTSAAHTSVPSHTPVISVPQHRSGDIHNNIN